MVKKQPISEIAIRRATVRRHLASSRRYWFTIASCDLVESNRETSVVRCARRQAILLD